MFSLQIDQAEASLTCPQRRMFVGSPPDCSTNSRLMMSMPPEPQHRVVDAQPRFGLENTNHEPDDVARRVEVAAFFARRFGEHVDEELVGGAKQVRELKIFVAQPVFAEMSYEIFAGVVGNDALVALHAHEADVVEDMFQRVVTLGSGRQVLCRGHCRKALLRRLTCLGGMPTAHAQVRRSRRNNQGLHRSPRLFPSPCLASILVPTIFSRSASKTSEQRFRKSIPKM